MVLIKIAPKATCSIVKHVRRAGDEDLYQNSQTALGISKLVVATQAPGRIDGPGEEGRETREVVQRRLAY